MKAIETEGLTRVFPGRTAVAGLDLAVRAGEIYGFLGPNGSGKTTTIRMLAGILRPSRGWAVVAGRDVRDDATGVRACVGLLPESLGYYGWMTTLEYLQFFGDLYDVPRAVASERAVSLLARVGLAKCRNARLATLSRGMRARLGIARALIHHPEVLLLDEPTLGLDPLGQRDVLALIQAVSRDGTTVFLSSHALDQVGHLCTRVGIINEGRLVAQGTPEELSRRLVLPPKLHLTVSDAPRALGVAARLGLFTGNTMVDERHVVATPEGVEPHAADLVRALVDAGVAVSEVVVGTPTLEDIFFALVQRDRQVAA